MSYKLKYFNIQSLSLHDGEGIRATVFLKGCPLRCLWCSNPESQCLDPCEGFGYFEHTIEDIVKRLERDAAFFRRSGGGVTLSGGEPFFQGEGVIRLLAACRASLWNTAVETSGYVKKELLEEAMPLVDTFYYDIKAVSYKKHAAFTGVSNERILSNLKMLCDAGSHVIVRYPYIPGYNSGDEDMALLEQWLLENCPGVLLEFLPYHKLGVSKYQRLGLPYALPEVKPPSSRSMEQLLRRFDDAGIVCRLG